MACHGFGAVLHARRQKQCGTVRWQCEFQEQFKAAWDKKKPQTREVLVVWGCLWWWSWRELNPRPQAFFGQIYMLSGLI